MHLSRYPLYVLAVWLVLLVAACSDSDTGVSGPAVSVPFTAWVGTDDAKVSFPASAAGTYFYRSTAPGCDIEAFQNCADSQVDLLLDGVVTDTALTLSRPAYYQLAYNGAISAETLISAQAFSPRVEHQVAEFDNKLWVIGGVDGNRLNDVWSSADGETWRTPISRTISFPPL